MSNIHKRGFASLSMERRREIASMGGKASPGNFKHNRERAKEAGSKGGKATIKDDKTDQTTTAED